MQLSAKTSLDNARRSADRGAELVKAHMISVQDNDNLQSALHEPRPTWPPRRRPSTAARVNLDYAHITSPISGRIGKSAVTQGALVVANQADALATVQQLDPIYVDVTQSSGEWLQLQQEIGGRRKRRRPVAKCTSCSRTARPIRMAGKLQFSDVTVRSEHRAASCCACSCPIPNHLLMPGMYVRATINEGELQQRAARAAAGHHARSEGQCHGAWWSAPTTRSSCARSRLARTIGDQWLVERGLSPGDRVIVEGLQKVQPGMPVQAEREVARPQPRGAHRPARPLRLRHAAAK